MGSGTGGLEPITKQPIIPISFKDVEIEKTAAGNIIHIFTDDDPHDLIERIIKSLYHLGYADNFSTEADELLKENEMPEWIIMALTETKRLLAKSLKESESASLDFMAHYEV